MSPTEISSSKSTAFILQELTTASYSPKRSSNRASFSKERRAQDSARTLSSLSPWGEETSLVPPRKSSLKGSSRQSKGSKNTFKEGKTKDRKENGKVKTKQYPDDNEKKISTNFRHYADISEYIREYREVRNEITSVHRNCSCHGTYGPGEIEKVYDSLGLPKLLQRARVLASSRKTILPALTDQEEQQDPEAEISDSETTSVVPSEDQEEGEEDGLTSPDARERRNNLNLSPLRKQVRLPDMHRYPVQSVAGLGVHELTRLATAKNRSRQHKNKSTDDSTPTLRYSISVKPILNAPLHLQERTLCRVVELSIPETSSVQTNETEDTPKNFTNHTKNYREISSRLVSKYTPKNNLDQATLSQMKTSELNEIQDDNLTLAIGTSRSNQSSVLSNAVSSLSSNSPSCGHNQARTVREMLTAAVRDLQPFSKNGAQEESEKKDILGKKENNLEAMSDVENSKQLVSLRTYRNLSYKPSMRKFMEDLYTPTADNLLIENKLTCLIAGKPLRRLDSLPEPVPPGIDNKNIPFPKANVSKLTQDVSKPNDLKRIGHRQPAVNIYESLRRVVALKNSKQNSSKLAIFSKCHTVVKPQVSVRGVAL